MSKKNKNKNEKNHSLDLFGHFPVVSFPWAKKENLLNVNVNIILNWDTEHLFAVCIVNVLVHVKLKHAAVAVHTPYSSALYFVVLFIPKNMGSNT